MATVNVIPLRTARKASKPKARPQAMSARMLRRLRLLHAVAVMVALVADAMTTVSLSHIAAFSIDSTSSPK
jgi:hypothetical protein